ncbi:hypothetical protein NC653_001159 [Populus alba x Populus x berolinensis]|uniref:Uncharacterized protein n=1 Tax=Populus alba x Populus x berolinensis TaxID=444605 RepID=A0AAD6WF57_9ROSI|nr:hypothetical protein NC653_001159 [Populus alba x Populus x berolinensis]
MLFHVFFISDFSWYHSGLEFDAVKPQVLKLHALICLVWRLSVI